MVCTPEGTLDIPLLEKVIFFKKREKKTIKMPTASCTLCTDNIAVWAEIRKRFQNNGGSVKSEELPGTPGIKRCKRFTGR